jgi:transcriptional regulator with XRE-family HTH domain
MYRYVSPASESFTAVSRQAWCQLFGGMVQDRREAIGRSVEETARLARMESSEWAAIEAGYVPADPARLRSMAAALEVRFDQMAMLVYLCQEAWEA